MLQRSLQMQDDEGFYASMNMLVQIRGGENSIDLLEKGATCDNLHWLLDSGYLTLYENKIIPTKTGYQAAKVFEKASYNYQNKTNKV